MNAAVVNKSRLAGFWDEVGLGIIGMDNRGYSRKEMVKRFKSTAK
jgi:hypothetical protein